MGASSQQRHREPDRVAQLESQLRAEHRAKRDLRAEVARLNSNVAELHANWQRSVDDVYKKDDWGRRVETLLHEERTRHQNTTNHYTTLLEDKEAQLHDLRRCLEAQRFQMSQALEEHSRAGQNLAQMLERERREWAIERETLQSELYGTQQLMKESETVSQSAEKCLC